MHSYSAPWWFSGFMLRNSLAHVDSAIDCGNKETGADSNLTLCFF